jgi:hypothetical protein
MTSLKEVRCLFIGHRWTSMPYDEADTSQGSFLRCRRCARESSKESSGVNGAIAWGWRPYT